MTDNPLDSSPDAVHDDKVGSDITGSIREGIADALRETPSIDELAARHTEQLWLFACLISDIGFQVCVVQSTMKYFDLDTFEDAAKMASQLLTDLRPNEARGFKPNPNSSQVINHFIASAPSLAILVEGLQPLLAEDDDPNLLNLIIPDLELLRQLGAHFNARLLASLDDAVMN